MSAAFRVGYAVSGAADPVGCGGMRLPQSIVPWHRN
jgi:hypothetical protein